MAKISQAINAIKFVGIRATIRTILFSINRDRIDKQTGPISHKIVGSNQPGRMTGTRRAQDHLLIEFENCSLKIKVLKPNMFQITWLPGKLPLPYAIAETEWGDALWKYEPDEEFVILRTEGSQLKVGSDGRIEYFTKDGELIRAENPPSFLEDGWSHSAVIYQNECIYGMGLKAAPLNLRGGKFHVWNTDPGGSYNPGDDPLYLNNPLYLGIHSYGSYLVFYENTYRSFFEFGVNAKATFTGGTLRYYIIVGPLPELLKDYTKLTGRPPLPPLWSLGYHQSRWGYKDETDVRRVVQLFAAHELPLDAIHLDIDYMDGYRVFTINQERFPDFQQLIQDLEEQNIKVIAILDPGVKVDPGFEVYCDGLARQFFATSFDDQPAHGLVWPGWCVFPDFSSPDVREWWGNYFKYLIDQGVAGIWHDMNEPAVFSAWGDVTLPNNTTHSGEGTGEDHRSIHNVYGMLMNQCGFEALQKLCPDQRPWILSRSGWAGSQRYAWNWTADANSTWEMLQQMIPMMLNLSLSGFYYSGSDIGGFSAHPSKELYIRWFQLAAYTPFFRLHNAVRLPPREPYQFDEETCEIVRQLLLNRKKLLPYLYTLAYQASQFGEPLLRPMAWEAQDDSDYWEIQDQFMLGPSLLIAPILSAGKTDRHVIFPDCDFYNFWSGELIRGKDQILTHARIDQIPVFVKAGSFVPLNIDQKLILKFFWPHDLLSGQTYMSHLYSDAGDGYGDFRYDQFELVKKGPGYTLSRTHTGSYPWPEGGIYLEFVGVEVSDLWEGGKLIAGDDNIYRINDPFDEIEIKLT